MGGMSKPRKQSQDLFRKRGNLYSESVTMVNDSVNLSSQSFSNVVNASRFKNL